MDSLPNVNEVTIALNLPVEINGMIGFTLYFIGSIIYVLLQSSDFVFYHDILESIREVDVLTALSPAHSYFLC